MDSPLTTLVDAAVEQWDKRHSWNVDILNGYLEKYESIFETFGMFPIGLRAVDSTGRIPYHKRIDGLLGIVSMNIEIIKAKQSKIHQFIEGTSTINFFRRGFQ